MPWRKQSKSRGSRRTRAKQSTKSRSRRTRQSPKSRQSRKSVRRVGFIPPTPPTPPIPVTISATTLAGGPGARFPPNHVFQNQPNPRMSFVCNSARCKGAVYTKPFQCVTSTYKSGIPVAIAECPRCHGTLEHRISVPQFMRYINLNSHSRCSFDYDSDA